MLILALIYLYYQNKKQPGFLTGNSSVSELQTQLDQIKAKLGEKSLDELLEENEDYETEVDTLTRTKNSLEADLLAQSNAYNSRIKEKDREIQRITELSKESEKQVKKFKEDLNSEKQQHKGSLERIKLLTEQIQTLEKAKQELETKLKKMPGEFPEAEWPPLSSKKDKK